MVCPPAPLDRRWGKTYHHFFNPNWTENGRSNPVRIRSRDGLIVVDIQKDFCPGGSLSVDRGDRVVPVINRLIPKFSHVFLSRDWHPPNHCSFSHSPKFVDKSWPVHCVAGSPGAEFHPLLSIPELAIVIDKGVDPDREAYSAFEETNLAKFLRDRGIDRIFVAGLATDYCVKSTVLDALNQGFETFLVQDACRGVDNPPGSVDKAIKEMKESGASPVRSEVFE
ncbi:MAG: nicotinamidase [Candidatus Omnitrophica bacterium]|nr:nicotinamidase [Candidatus Omnitrophota bacterium]MCA9446008.1 nicotinamidase [Candidatus Omnitrophota bacterium]